MKTTDRKQIRRGKTYFIVDNNKIYKTKCVNIFQNEYCVNFLSGHSFSYGPAIHGKLYSSQEKAKIRLKFLLKNVLKHYQSRVKEYENLLEKLK